MVLFCLLCYRKGGFVMMNRIFNIVKNKKKLAEIKKIANQYGMKLTSSLLMSICILITSNAFREKLKLVMMQIIL